MKAYQAALIEAASGASDARPEALLPEQLAGERMRTIHDLPQAILYDIMNCMPAPPNQRENEQQLSSLQMVSRAFRDATQDGFRSEPHAGARRERFAIAVRDILCRPGLRGAELFDVLTKLFGMSKDVGLNFALVSDPGKLNILLDVLSGQNGLRTLHINASGMGADFPVTIAALLRIIDANPALTECKVDVRDNDQGAQAALLIEQHLTRAGVAGSVNC